jgi:competence protein ComFB
MHSVENWYEKIVFEKIRQVSLNNREMLDSSLWADVACLALNHLPPRYVRHSVDMTFYLSPQEQMEMDQRVDKAIANALTYVKQHPALGNSAA